MSYSVNFDRARLVVYCNVHDTDVEYVADFDPGETFLDKASLACPGLSKQLVSTFDQIDKVSALAKKEAALKYKRDHPDLERAFPADWLPLDRVSDEDYSDLHKNLLLELDRYQEEATDRCYRSWEIILEEIEPIEPTKEVINGENIL